MRYYYQYNWASNLIKLFFSFHSSYTSGGLKYYFHQKFDQAMVAFLDCLQQFNEEAHRQDSEFSLPYEYAFYLLNHINTFLYDLITILILIMFKF